MLSNLTIDVYHLDQVSHSLFQFLFYLPTLITSMKVEA